MNWLSNPDGLNSGNLFSRPFGTVSQCIIEIQIDAPTCLSALAAAQVPFDIKKNNCAK
jgi:hypothetical protein